MREVSGILGLLLLVWFHYRTEKQIFLKSYYFLFLLIKLAAGVGVGLLYSYYYSGGDTWNYFNQAKLLGEAGFSSFADFVSLFIQNKYEMIDGFSYTYQPRAALMVKLVAFINVFSHSNYWITSLYFSFFSFIGIYKFSAWVVNKFEYGKAAAITVFVWPGFLFWSSGILKETIAVGLIFWIIPAFFEFQKTKSVKKIILVLTGLFFLFSIKYYFAAVLFIILLLYSFSLAIKLNTKSIFQQLIIWVLMLTLGFGLGGFLHPNLRFENIVGVIMENNQAFTHISSPQSLILFTEANQDWVWLLVNTPKALLASLFFPLLSENNLMFLLASIENWVLIALMIRGAFLLKLSTIKNNITLLLPSFSYIIILAVFLALSTPNLGTLSRYKVSFMPIVLVLVLLANRVNYFKNKQ